MLDKSKNSNVRCAKSLASAGKTKSDSIITDPQGCYTGRPMDRYEIPVQDADDL